MHRIQRCTPSSPPGNPNALRRRGASRRPKFAGSSLTAPRQDWPTNGGDWYNRRYSPLQRNQPRHGRASKGRLAGTAERLGIRAPVFGRSAADRVRRRAVRLHGRQRRVRHRRRHRRDRVDVQSEPRPRDLDRVLRLDESRRRHRRRQGLRRPARRQARRARSEHGQGRLVHPGRALAGRVHDHDGAALLRRPASSRASPAPSSACADA